MISASGYGVAVLMAWLIDGIPPGVMAYDGPTAVSVIAVLVITRRLIWHTDMDEVKTERDEWKDMALRGLGIAEKTTAYAEVATEVLTQRPTTDGGP